MPSKIYKISVLFPILENVNLFLLFFVFKINATSVVDLFVQSGFIATLISLLIVYMVLLKFGSSNFLESIHFLILYPIYKSLGILREDIKDFQDLRIAFSYSLNSEELFYIRFTMYVFLIIFLAFCGIQWLSTGSLFLVLEILEVFVLAVFIMNSLIHFAELKFLSRILYLIVLTVSLFLNYVLGFDYVYAPSLRSLVIIVPFSIFALGNFILKPKT